MNDRFEAQETSGPERNQQALRAPRWLPLWWVTTTQRLADAFVRTGMRVRARPPLERRVRPQLSAAPCDPSQRKTPDELIEGPRNRSRRNH